MLTIRERNVNTVFPVGIMFLREHGVKLNSRNGPVLEYPEPVSIRYDRPTERVLFNKKRAINPFLHFFEPLWILAGRSDVKFLADIVPRFKEYSDNGVDFHGAYGKRLRCGVGDQIKKAIQILRDNHDDRRVVLQIRDADDMWYTGSDTPCNTAIACKIRDGKLNIHVFNRSNDYIWGMTGANMPQFSVLQEYMAGHIGVEVGVYHQTTDSMHIYTENPQWDKLQYTSLSAYDPYSEGVVQPYPMITSEDDAYWFDVDLATFFAEEINGIKCNYSTDYFNDVVRPMWNTFKKHKQTKQGMSVVETIQAEDWRVNTKIWLGERE